jgi:hypothetical protein
MMVCFSKSRRALITNIGMIAEALALCSILALAGCNETAGDFNPNAAPRARAPGIPVALVSLEGAPETVTSRLSVALLRQALRRDIQIVGVDGQPRYQVRGYVSFQPAPESGVAVAWTFDLFDVKRKRAHRASGTEPVSLRSEDWSAVKDTDYERIAFRALDEIAEFLAASPGSAPVATQVPRRSPDAGRSVSLLVEP